MNTARFKVSFGLNVLFWLLAYLIVYLVHPTVMQATTIALVTMFLYDLVESITMQVMTELNID